MDFAAAGLGLQYGVVGLVPADAGWSTLADDLSEGIRRSLTDMKAAVEHVGSTAVPGLLAKPIVDLAIGVPRNTFIDDIAGRLSQLGWLYRGDAGDDGGWVFVMEDRPWHRVAHAHGVEYDGEQWTRYLQFRDLLRRSSGARAAYEEAKQRLAEQHPDDVESYTAGKSETVHRLLRSNG